MDESFSTNTGVNKGFVTPSSMKIARKKRKMGKKERKQTIKTIVEVVT